MPQIIAAELKVFRAANISDTSANGGRMSSVEVTSNVVANVFGNIEEAERAAGSTKYRKVFFKVHHDGNDKTLLDARLFQSANSAGDDRVQFFLGTQTDTQSAITGSERKYGCGALDVTVSAGASSIDVEVEPGVTGIYLNGDMLLIKDASGSEYVTISGVPSQAGDIVTIALAAPLVAGYSSATGLVSSVYAAGNIAPSSSAVSVTSASTGAYNATGNVTLNNKGVVSQTYTLTFVSPTAFNISGNTLGALGSGTVSGGASPSNPAFSVPYFTLGAAGFSGAFLTGDTIVVTTTPAAIPVWLKRTTPAGAAVLSASTPKFKLVGGTT